MFPTKICHLQNALESFLLKIMSLAQALRDEEQSTQSFALKRPFKLQVYCSSPVQLAIYNPV